MSQAILSVSGISVVFGGIVALNNVSFDVPSAGIVGLIGPNGAGKTTLFNCLSRVYTPTKGSISFLGNDLLAFPPHRMAGLGIGRTFQNIALFQELSVLDNVRIGAHSKYPSSFLGDLVGLPSRQRNEQRILECALEAISYIGLDDVMHQRVSDLPFGTQKRVELARALALDPKLLLLDEPACGLNHEEVQELGTLIRRIRDDRQLAILLVEHHMSLVMALSDTIVALNFGQKIAEGPPEVVRKDPQLIAAYLGGDKAA